MLTVVELQHNKRRSISRLLMRKRSRYFYLAILLRIQSTNGFYSLLKILDAISSLAYLKNLHFYFAKKGYTKFARAVANF